MYLGFCYFQRSDSLYELWSLSQMVNKCVRSKCKYNLHSGQLGKDSGNQCQRYLREASLVQKKNCSAGTRLSLPNFFENAFKLVFKSPISNNDLITTYAVSAFSQSLSKMIRVGFPHVHKVALAIKP